MPIKFGTDGWRDIIADGFTYENVRKVARAHAQYLRSQGGQEVIIGYDTRFQSQNFARVAAHAFASCGLNVQLSDTFIPTPALSFAVWNRGAAGGAMITASHNPPEYNGYKLKGPYGGSATPAIVRAVEEVLESEAASDTQSGQISPLDVRQAYYTHLDTLLDLDTLRSYPGVLYHDAMGGAGAGWLEGYVRHAGLPVEVRSVHGNPSPLFYGVNPEPIPQNLAALMDLLQGEQGLTFGVATDGDADRLGAVTSGGHFFNSHQIFAVLLQHLHAQGGRGRVVKTVSTSQVVERLASILGLEVLETPIGFKYIADAFLEGEDDRDKRVLIGGEESGGLGVAGHIPERDGLLISLLLLEAVAKSGQGPRELFAEIERRVDYQHHYDRVDLLVDRHFDKVGALERAGHWTTVAGHTVKGVNARDGVKLLLEGDAWLLLRASGTEPVLRVYVEAPTAKAQQAILQEAVERVQTSGPEA
ncbi:phosphohexose mutase [Deinococcus malanensis]|uniref:Phosphohexose mutase n=1 Tax=Deinococcus malanensis TaxID=1706855 RepID=A0ABQ2F4E3_9DEIO|nr:phosphoglucomutase/phosphomannomutase family protein [Deinococcus malanensis]GGK39845.1 phosphohexose mutase [Deinococcus malanensis]